MNLRQPLQRRVTQYSVIRAVGKGTFGIVYEAEECGTGRIVAVKKVFQDKNYKNRELQMMKLLSHPNVVTLYNSFYSQTEAGEYLHLVMEYIPDNLYRYNRRFVRAHTLLPLIYVKLYTYQMFKGLAYIHSRGICHRDIKPQNVLIDPKTHVIKICDFGSAKRLSPNEPNVCYICSRYYRAPELIFGATNYTVAVDIWSMACVVAELLTGSSLFPGENNVGQMVEIIKVLGTPTDEQVRRMNPNYNPGKFPNIAHKDLSEVLVHCHDAQAIDLMSKLLVYIPEDRLTASEVLRHPFFDELRALKQLPDGAPLPEGLFDD
ncbi:Protein kinase [Blastocystis hominis]|uniref:Protein kinase n=1 Tax=Blastocystis hominis TaxID=12968 RepID=D8M8C8_BLAHO|nr:Protein kinase [Blastocystis hominis]CBK24317.2 Protein kinase [Blastocystis hominis]|eukprot:XP_012898365.1 Protein kinase [Blastocystis hominis]